MQSWTISCTGLAFTYDVGFLGGGGKQEDKSTRGKTCEGKLQNL
jgi:hypothetical protein